MATHVDALDGLRGVAILGVLAFHTGHLPGGFLGVDLFFVLSGHLITGLLLREARATGGVSLVAFWGRRARRLLPALAVVLAAVAVAARLAGPPDVARAALADGPWVQLNLVNWHLLAESASYWDRFGSARAFEHLWSIAVEEQFYVAWPAVLIALAALGARGLERRVAAVAGLGAAASVALMVALADPADPTRAHTGTDTRAASLLLGALVATAPGQTAIAAVARRWAAPAATIAAGALAVAWALAGGAGAAWLFDGGLLAHALAAAALIGLCAHAPQIAPARALAWRPLVGLGLISYGLYLWHWPVAVLLSRERTGLGPWPWTLLVVAASVALAVASKHAVEDPIRFRARWARGRRGAVALAALMAGLAALWIALPSPPPPPVDVDGLRRVRG